MTFDSYADINDALCQSEDVPEHTYNPKTSGFPNYCQHGTNIPGKWTGTSAPFVNLAYLSNFNKKENETSSSAWQDDDVIEETLDCQAITGMFI